MANVTKLISIMGNSQSLDGGAMFGNVPKALWSQWVEQDHQNRILLGCRILYVECGDQKILFETGIGSFFEPKLKERFGVIESSHKLVENLRSVVGVEPEDIDVIVLSHLHFDHAGGLLTPYQEAKAPELQFTRAKYLVGRVAWERAKTPHYRDRASFLPELNQLIESSGRLEIIDGKHAEALGEWVTFHYSDGHTPGMLISEINTPQGNPLFFAADLIPGIPWVHLPVTMGYDRYPEKLIDEKKSFLEKVVAADGRIFFTHDPKVACAKIAFDEKGRFVTTQTWDVLNTGYGD